MAVVRGGKSKQTLNHTSEIVLKPIIEEIVRTEVYPPSLIFLVDKIFIVPIIDPSDQVRREAYRIWLSDGENAIQAILKQEIHPFVKTGEIREGSFVNVTKYNLARRKRLRGEGEVVHLEVANFYAIGHDKRSPHSPTYESTQSIEEESRGDASQQSQKSQKSSQSAKPLPCVQDENDSYQDDLALEHLESCDDAVDLVKWTDRSAKEKEVVSADSDIAPNPKKRKYEEDTKPLQSRNTNLAARISKVSRSSSMQSARDKPETASTRLHKSQEPRRNSPPQLRPISRPIKLTSLAQLTGANATRNEIHDVFAVVCSVDENIISRKGMQDTRHIRIMDPSTTKKVLLSVFVDPHHFRPAVGTVALIRSVLTHTWDGGSLNVYAKQCRDRQWFIKEPVGVAGCDTQALKAWWARRGGDENAG